MLIFDMKLEDAAGTEFLNSSEIASQQIFCDLQAL